MSIPTTVDAHQLHELSQRDAAPRLIDVRTPAEFETAHIPGAYNVPLDLLREHRNELAEHLDEVVLMCRSGQRAVSAEDALRRAGLANVHILAGGITAWQAAGFEVRHGKPRWELERQVRLVAGLVVALSVLVGAIVPGVQWVAFAIGAGLAVAAITNTCAMGNLLSRLPYNRTTGCDIDAIVGELLGTQGKTRST
jgi:rhodanese-related sulfurtransferase